MYKSGYSNRTLLEAFEDNFIPEPNSGCWLWTGAIFKRRGGYGAFTHTPSNTIVKRAHRVAWKLYKNMGFDLAKSVHVLHTCDNPICVNPDHLFLGDQISNMEDKSFKGRQGHAANHPNFRHGGYVGVKQNPIYKHPLN